MDPCFTDVTVEFLGVAFHNILYYTSVYPKTIFETRKKYNVVVYRCIHPEVSQYIDLCLKSIEECLRNDNLNRVEFAVTDDGYNPLMKFVFDFQMGDYYDKTADAYLVQTEQNLRAFCLNLASISHKFKDIHDDCSFSIYVHTNESTAVMIAGNPEFENFPLIEVEDKNSGTDKIIPLRRFSVRNYHLDTYIEIK